MYRASTLEAARRASEAPSSGLADFQRDMLQAAEAVQFTTASSRKAAQKRIEEAEPLYLIEARRAAEGEPENRLLGRTLRNARRRWQHCWCASL